MAEPFKNFINPSTVKALSTALHRLWPAFDARRFERQAVDGLQDLELKARALHVSHALEARLPADFGAAAGLLERLLQDEHAPGGWALWPVGDYIARRGLDQPALALALLRTMTPRFSAEFAIRPFIAQHAPLAFETLARWAVDGDEPVRRLVSEGSRPRLPWGLRLQALVADPSPTLPLLRALQDDPDDAVRRSVANHLNDIAKDHPALVADWIERHLPGAPPARRALLRHASRTLVKQGDRRVLAAWGLGRALRGDATLTLQPGRVHFGDGVTLTLRIESRSRQAQALAIDYALHHVKADGSTRPKVFKGWKVELPAQGLLTLVKRHVLKPITTRRYHPGRHVVDVQVNGRVVASAAFELVMP